MPATVTKIAVRGLDAAGRRGENAGIGGRGRAGHAVGENRAVAVNVGEKGVQGADALNQAGFEVGPSGGID